MSHKKSYEKNFNLKKNQHYLEQRRESDSLLIVKVGAFVDEGDVVLVQFTSSFAVLLG